MLELTVTHLTVRTNAAGNILWLEGPLGTIARIDGIEKLTAEGKIVTTKALADHIRDIAGELEQSAADIRDAVRELGPEPTR